MFKWQITKQVSKQVFRSAISYELLTCPHHVQKALHLRGFCLTDSTTCAFMSIWLTELNTNAHEINHLHIVNIKKHILIKTPSMFLWSFRPHSCSKHPARDEPIYLLALTCGCCRHLVWTNWVVPVNEWTSPKIRFSSP